MRRAVTRWYVSSPGWWWSRRVWSQDVPEPPFASHSEHRTLKAARKSARALLRAGAGEAHLFCVYKNGESRPFVYSVGQA